MTLVQHTVAGTRVCVKQVMLELFIQIFTDSNVLEHAL